MPLFRVTIRLEAPLGTPLTSGTLFGHLCWAKRELEGEAALTAWLAAQEETPWALSDGFPAGLLPRPLLAPLPPPDAAGAPSAKCLEQADRDKDLRKRAWIRVTDFLRLRPALDEAALRAALAAAPPPADGAWPQRLAHNSIDRHTGGTPEAGGLYFVDEDWGFLRAADRDVYVAAETDAATLHALFAHVGMQGFGRDATWGRGVFSVGRVERADELADFAGNRMLSLSHGTISANMRDARYRLFTHFGKVGIGMAAAGARPWKRPVLLTRPGATFAPDGPGPYGALLGEVHQDRAEIRHNALHVALPFREPAAAGAIA